MVKLWHPKLLVRERSWPRSAAREGEMATPLLKTKLYIPSPRPNLVPRPRLIERLNAGLRRRLTLISAPAGFGKTTLLSEWAAGCGRPVAWVSLDKGDNDPSRFLVYFIAALRMVREELGETGLAMLQSPQLPPVESVLTTLINEIAVASGQGQFALVLDDYHTIKSQSIHNALTFLLDHLPPQMHLVIATRADPPLPLPRLRVQGELTELRITDLRFNDDEVAAFFNKVMDLGLSTDDIAALASRTEGWAAGLQVAALSLQGREDATSFIQAFTGSNRYILDYLVVEVLQQQTEPVQTFLLQTAILDRLTGPLCDAVCSVGAGVTTKGSGQATLEGLERANLFVIPLDDERRWYRYHQLFADLLRARLRQMHPDWIPELYRKAAEWHEQNRLMAEAVGHRLAARDFEEAARLVEQIAQATLWMRGEMTTFLGWLEALPEEVVRTRPQLILYHTWALLTVTQLDAVEARLRDIEHIFGETEDSVITEAERHRMRGEVTVIRAMVANFRGDRSRAIQLCNQALEIIPEDNLFLRATIVGNLGGAYAVEGDVVAASHAFAEASRLSKAAGNIFTALIAISYLAEMQVSQGQLHQAAKTYQQALELAAERGGRQLPLAGMAYVGMGQLLHEWNDLDEAKRYLMEGIKLSEQQGDTTIGPGLQVLVDGCVALARVYQAQSDVSSALEVLNKAEQLTRKHASPLSVQVRAAQAQLWVAQGNLAAAGRWAQECGLGLDDEPDYLREFEYLTLARVLVAQGKQDDATVLLARLGQAAEAAGRVRSLVEILAFQAVALQARGETVQAVVALERALSLAEPEGYIRIFVDEGPPMEKLLRRALSRGVAPDYVSRLLASIGKTAETISPVSQRLIEPLSPRELEVLRLSAGGFSNREIAEALVIAVTTVKKHISNIYGKLGVRSRTQAVARARDLNLL